MKTSISEGTARKLIAGKLKSVRVVEETHQRGVRRLNIVYKKSGRPRTLRVRKAEENDE